jgi:secreted trypsin-like serine protease
MRAAIFCTLVALAAGKSMKSLKAISTPLSRGGGRIVGGEDAYYGEFPHQIALLRGGVGGSLMCGGSIVDNSWVVTAGHCCDGQSASRLGVRVGSHNLYSEDADQMDFAVKTVLLHEEYDDWNIENDICLLELDGSATYGSHVGAISLPYDGEEYTSGTSCTVSGWGTTSEGGSLASVLQKVSVPVVSDDDCRDAYGQTSITDSMICAGLDAGGKDSCQGDSGGPFMCGNQLSGVVSWGYGCAEAGYPGVYTQTSYFISWLNSHM